MTDTSGVAADRLRSFVERLERLADEQAEIADQAKDVMSEAKNEGFDAKALRAVLKLRRMKEHERREAEELLDLYKSALGMAP